MVEIKKKTILFSAILLGSPVFLCWLCAILFPTFLIVLVAYSDIKNWVEMD